VISARVLGQVISTPLMLNKIAELNLSKNPLRDEGVKELSRLVLTQTHALVSLNLSSV